MLQGVEILSQEAIPVMETNEYIFLFGWIVAIILFIIIDIKVDTTLSVVVFFSVIGISLSLSYGIPRKTGEYTQYKVIISDEVNFTEFNEKYEVLEQDGKIYIIKERDKNIK